MDSIDKAIKFCETGKRPDLEDYSEDEPTSIYSAIETLRVNNTYYFLQWWIAAKEFQRSKLTRSNFIPHTEKDGESEGVEIEIHNVSDTPTGDAI